MSTVKLTVNGKAVSAEVEDRTLLVHLLRDQLNLGGSGGEELDAQRFLDDQWPVGDA